MNFRASAMLCLIVCAFTIIPLAVSTTIVQAAEVSVGSAVSYEVTGATEGGGSGPQGLPIDTPGGPT